MRQGSQDQTGRSTDEVDVKLTKKERAKLTKKHNKASKKTYKKKHNEKKKIDVGGTK